MSSPEMLALLRQAVEQVTGRDLGPLPEEADLRSLGLDSVQLLEMIAWSEGQLGFRVADEAFGRLQTVGDLCAILEASAPQERTGQEVAP